MRFYPNSVFESSVILIAILSVPFSMAKADCLDSYRAVAAKTNEQILKDQNGVKALDSSYKKQRYLYLRDIGGGAAGGATVGALTLAVPGAIVGGLYGGLAGGFASIFDKDLKHAEENNDSIDDQKFDIDRNQTAVTQYRQNTNDAYYMIREATVYKSPGNLINRLDQDIYPGDEKYSQAVSIMKIIQRHYSAGDLCDTLGGVATYDDIKNLVELAKDEYQSGHLENPVVTDVALGKTSKNEASYIYQSERGEAFTTGVPK